MAEIPTIDANDIVKSVELNISITGCTKFRIKRYIGILVIKAGMWIIGVTGKVEAKD